LSQLKDSKDPKTDAKSDPKAGGKPRVYTIATELSIDTKTILEYCKDLGYTSITSQLKSLEPDQVEALKLRHKNGKPKPAAAPAATTATKPAPIPTKIDTKIPTIAKPKTAAPKPVEVPEPVAEAPVAPVVVEAPVVVAEVVSPVEPEVVEKVAPAMPKLPTKMPNLGSNKPMNLGSSKPKSTATPKAVVEMAPVVEAVAEVAAQEPVVEVPVPVVAEVVAPEPVAAVVEEVAEVVAPVVAPQPPVAKPNTFQPPAHRAPTILPPNANRGMPSLNNRPTVPQAPRPIPAQPQAPAATSAPGAPPRPASTPPNPGPPQSASGRTPPNPGPPSTRTPPNPGPRQQAGTNRPIPQGGNRYGPPGSNPSGPPQGQGPAQPQRPAQQPAAQAGGAKSVRLTMEQIQRLRQLEQQKNGRINIGDVSRQVSIPQAAPEAPNGPTPPGGRPPMQGPSRPMPGGKPDGDGAAGRDQRQKQRQERGRDVRPGSFRNAVVIGPRGSVDMIENNRHIKKHRGKSHVKAGPIVLSGKVEIEVPITVRGLSTTIGMKVGELILKLKNVTNSLYTMNSNVEFDVAEMVAIEKGIELVAKKSETTEDEVLRKLREKSEASDTANTSLRPPIVTIMGHVDHGKTSLLDRIRAEYGLESDVVSTEAGGITQVLRAWRVQKDGKSTTFLDTPGHEAFTKMRARGANVTDIAVIVVSATDGIMPQTQEAVAHAKAADVDIIVAINKCDLPGAQPEKVKNRLFDMELVPEDMGGDVPVIYTSAMTGQGIAELLDSISLLAELGELKADSTVAGSGTCLEAYMEEDRGVVATFLVQNGTVRKGDIILCGSTYGRVRAMYDDLAQPITEAGPSTPIKLIGLNAVPDADDPFYVVDDVATAREIAEQRQDTRQEFDRIKFSPVSLDKLKEQSSRAKISELKIILKAEARGSVEAIKKELEKLIHDEVRVRVLHAGIGAINESDVTLALTSPEDTIIVGFNVTSDDPALKLAEQRSIKIQEYQIIYNLVDDVKAALEGRLKPIEEVVHLGRAIVRETFKITKTGTIAGCYVTSGNIERSARVRVIRDGVVLYPTGEKVVGLDSLKRFKDDAKEVREGFECGLKITGFDDIKVGDVIEAFKIEIKTRTL
jgi:translation initiation factor IF-2